MCALRVNENKITAENVFNRDDFVIGGNHESNNNKKLLFKVCKNIWIIPLTQRSYFEKKCPWCSLDATEWTSAI